MFLQNVIHDFVHKYISLPKYHAWAGPRSRGSCWKGCNRGVCLVFVIGTTFCVETNDKYHLRLVE